MAVVESKKSVFRAGAYVYIEGDEDSDEIFIVERGEIELKTAGEKIKKFNSVIRPGEVFGFTTALCRRPRMDSARARRDSIVIAIQRDKFIEMVQSNPPVALKIVNYFAGELRAYNEMMFSLDDEDRDILPDETRLFNLCEYYYDKAAYQYAQYSCQRYLELHPDAPNSASARTMIKQIEQVDNRMMLEPVKTGIYKLYADRQMIFSEYEQGNELYIIKEGKVKIIKVSSDEEIMLSVLKEGDIFGELAIVSNKPRNASAIAWGKTTLLPIAKETLPVLLKKSPGMINRIFMAISQRIWFTYIRLESRVYSKPVTRVYVFLENKLLEEHHSLKDTQPVTLNFGIDELFRMMGISPSNPGPVVNLLMDDNNLNFNFGQITIENPTVLSMKAKFLRSRDHIVTGDEGEEQPRNQRARTEQSSSGAMESEGLEATYDEILPPEKPAKSTPTPRPEPVAEFEQEEDKKPAPAKKEQAPPTGEAGDELKLVSDEISFDM
ncbi:MAG: cyclic nucleotide-binding domain-containing protein [Spirochaetes bacterium]|nr:MAG: cyclic nucleotide-binding domain-containing protein [Spirochaetota bacterium]